MRRPPATAIVAAALLAGCAITPEPPPVTLTQQQVTAPPDAVRTRLRQALSQQGFSVADETGGGIVARRAGPVEEAWAACPRLIVTDEQNEYFRSDWAAARALAMEVRIGLQPATGGTVVRIATEPRGTYVDRYRNTAFEAPCSSTGQLERSLLGAAAAG